MRFLSLFLLVLLQGLAQAQAAEGKRPGRPPAPVQVVPAEARAMAPSQLVAGTVISRYDARLAAEVTGVLRSVAEVGELKKKGETIARIDDTDARLRAAEARAGVAREKARLQYLDSEVGRLEQLAASNSAARTQLDLARADRDVAFSELAVARIRQQQAEEDLARTHIRAPFAGVVVQRFKYQGERIDKGQEIARFASPDQVEVAAMVSADAIAHLRQGQKLDIQHAGSTIPATVSNIVRVGDERSRLYELRLALPQQTLVPGQTVRVQVPQGAQRQVVAVPRDALVLRNKGISVFRINGEQQAEQVPVTTGIASGDWIEVIGNVQAGDRVVIRGGERLRPGATVSVIGESAGARKGDGAEQGR